MALFEAFDHWTQADFDAYAQTKWRSNRFNRERGEVRQRLTSALEQARAHSDAPLGDLALWTSRDHPAFVNGHEVRHQLAIWCREPSLREALQARDPTVLAEEPQTTHAHAGLCLDEQRLTWLLAVPAEARFDQAAWRTQVQELERLAREPGAVLRLGGELAEPGALAQAASSEAAVDLRIEWPVARDAVLAGAVGVEELGAKVAQTLIVLRAVLDAVPEIAAPPAAPAEPTPAAAEVVQPSRAAILPPPRSRPMRPVAPAGSAHQEARPEPHFEPRFEPRPPPRPLAQPPVSAHPNAPRPQSNDRRDQAPRGPGPEQPRRPAPPQPSAPGPGRPAHAGAPHPGGPRRDDRGPRPQDPRSQGPRAYELGPDPRAKEAFAAVAPGARVTLLAGLFAGKIATVQSVSGDAVQVLLGSMAVKVALADLRLAP